MDGAARRLVEDFPQLSFLLGKLDEGEYLEALADVDMNSIPGYPLCQYGVTNGDVLEADGFGNVSIERAKMLFQFVSARWEALKEAPDIDPIVVFPKLEPHTKKKIAENRIRLIFGVSLVDNMVYRMLFRRLSVALMDWKSLPSKLGWAPQCGGFRSLRYLLAGKSRSYVSVDKSSWDWTVNEVIVDLLLSFVKYAAVGDTTVAINAVKSMFGPVLLKLDLRGGNVRKISTGVMPSGCYLTLAFNTLSQLLVHNLVTSILDVSMDYPLAVGDDTVHIGYVHEDYFSWWEKLGMTIKMAIPSVGHFEFVGHRLDIDEGTITPVYHGKHAYNLCHAPLDRYPEVAAGYALLYAKHPLSEILTEKVLVGTPYYRNAGFIRRWYDGLDTA